MKNKITFIPASEDVEKYVSPPVPIKLEVPEWYKKIETEYLKSPKFSEQGQLSNTSLKQCIPFFDAMTAGYVQKTWCDIYINPVGDSFEMAFPVSPEPLGMRNKVHIKYYDDEYYPAEFFWQIPWQVKLPEGYSVFAIHPLNRQDLPFTTMSGLIDADRYHHAPFGNMPVYIKKGFRGIIPAGTPMYQFIPIKREGWESATEEFSEEEIKKKLRYQISKFWGFYKDNFWHRKEYY